MSDLNQPPASSRSTDPLLRGPQPFLMLVDRAVVECRRWFHRLYWPAGLTIGLAQVGIAGSQLYTFGGMTEPGDQAVFGSCVALLAILSFGLLAIGVYSVQWTLCTDALSGAEPRWGSAIRFVLRPIHVLTFLVSALAITVGLVMCFVPGMVLGALLIVLVPTLRVEGSGIGAISRSARLVGSGPDGRIAMGPIAQGFLLLVLSSALNYAVAGVFQLPAALLQQYILLEQALESAGGGLSPQLLLLQLPASFLTGMAQALVYYYIGMAVSLFYFDLRCRREGQDLERALDELEVPALASGNDAPMGSPVP
ncbi:MAG: hypothetical protein AAGD01_16905 [Acidobacteriota bacterium]